MKIHASGEDYLEAVLVLQKKLGMVRSVDVARYMEVSKPSVCYAVGTLREGGFLTMDEKHYLHLTELGRDMAEKIYERHCFFRKITQIPIIILADASSLLCMSWKKESIYAGADCVMDINSTIEEVDLQIFSLARRNNKQKITQKQSETMINKGKLVMDHKKHKVFWNRVALHLTRQEYNFLYLLAVTPMRVYTFEQIYQLVWKDYSVGDIKNIIWCLVKRLRKKLNAVEDGAGNCIVSVRDIGYKFELNKENEQQ